MIWEEKIVVQKIIHESTLSRRLIYFISWINKYQCVFYLFFFNIYIFVLTRIFFTRRYALWRYKADNGRKTSINISFYYEFFIVDWSSGENYVLKTNDKLLLSLLCYYIIRRESITIWSYRHIYYRKRVHDGYSIIIFIIINIITVGIAH